MCSSTCIVCNTNVSDTILLEWILNSSRATNMYVILHELKIELKMVIIIEYIEIMPLKESYPMRSTCISNL
jgi:hypothetical protein